MKHYPIIHMIQKLEVRSKGSAPVLGWMWYYFNSTGANYSRSWNYAHAYIYAETDTSFQMSGFGVFVLICFFKHFLQTYSLTT